MTYCRRFEDPYSDGDEPGPCHGWGDQTQPNRLTLLQPCLSGCLGAQSESLR